MKTGLILVDIQNDYFPGGRMELAGISEAGQRAGELLSTFRESNRPAFHIQHLAIQQGATFFTSCFFNSSKRPVSRKLLG